MKTVSRITTTLSLASLLITLGCASRSQVKTALRLETIDTIPAEPAKGYVEFSSVSREAVVPIFLLDEQRRPRLLAATGLNKGAHYSFTSHPTIVAEKVRIALPAGVHTFMIERDGPILRVSVETGKVTPVELSYVALYNGATFVTYRVTSQAFQPAPFKESPGKG